MYRANFDTFLNLYSTEIIGGLIVSILFLLIENIYNFIKNIRTTRMYSGYTGNYYLYSFSSSGKDLITITNLSIKPRLGKLCATANIEDIYYYRGTMFITERNIYINLRGIKHTEKVQLIFYSPLHRKIKNLIGSINAISVIDEPFSSICILSDKERNAEDIKNEFNKVGVTYKNSMLKVSKDCSLFFNNIDF